MKADFLQNAVTVIGAGYVGLPLSELLVKNKYSIFILTRSKEKAEKLNRKNKSWTVVTNPQDCIPQSKFIVVCVPTPIFENKKPDLGILISTIQTIAQFIKKGQHVIIESSIAPFTCEKIITPLLEKSGLIVGEEIELSHCPERINPGDKKWHTENIPRVIGSISKKGLKSAADFYRTFIQAEIYELSIIAEVEMTKMVENSFRDVNIALVNELSKLTEKLNLDITRILAASATKPFGFLPHAPGIGVGGHCIAVDPYYLFDLGQSHNISLDLIKQARDINESMPHHAVKSIARFYKNYATPIGILGISYKPNISDVRESPALQLIHLIEKKSYPYETWDPWVPELSSQGTIQSLFALCKIIVIATAHTEIIKKLTPALLKKYAIKAIFDGRNCLNQQRMKRLGIEYQGIGR